MAARNRAAAASGVVARRAAAFFRYSSSIASRRAVRVSLVVGLTLVVAAWIAFAQIRLFPSILNKCAVAHPWLLHSGFVDYRDIPGQKSPLLPMFLSWLLPLFGYDAALAARTMHVVFIALIVVTALLWAYRHAGTWAWVAAAVFFFTWSNFFGLWATTYYDVALAPIYLLFFVLLSTQVRTGPGAATTGLDARVLAATGFVNGLAILTKQHAALLALPVAVLLAWHLLSRRATFHRILGLGTAFAAALLLPVVAYVAYYYARTGSLADLVYWTVTVNFGPYGSDAALAPALSHLRDMVPALVMFVPFLASLLLPAAGARPGRGIRLLLLAMFLLASVLLYPRYSPRHWPAAFPFLAIVSGIAFADLARGWRERRAGGLPSMGAAVIVLWLAIAAIIYGPILKDPRPDVWEEYSDLVALASDLDGRLPPDGAVALVPLDEGNANLSYLLDRLPPPYWLMNYSWWMNPTVIGRWLEVMEETQPPTVLFFPEGIDLSSSAPAMLEYVKANYQVVESVRWGATRQVQIMKRLPVPMPYLESLAQALVERTRSGDVVLVTPEVVFTPIAAQYRGPALVYPLPSTPEEVAARVAGYDRIFLVIGSPGAGAGENAGAQAWLDAHAFRAGHEWIESEQLVVYGVASLPADPAVDVGALFGHGETTEIELAGYDLPSGPWRPGDVLPLTLFWRAEAPLAADYKVFVHLLDAFGQIVAQNDAAPVAGLRPTSDWTPAEIVVDPHGLLLRGTSSELAPGEYKLHVGIYLPATGERLVVAKEPAMSSGDSLFLTSIQVVPPEGE